MFSLILAMASKRTRGGLTLLAAIAATLLAAPVAASCLGMELHAHRGASGTPENSRASVAAAAASGWPGVEIDVQRLRSGEWVLHHDVQTGRTTSISRQPVANLTATAWREVRLRDSRGALTQEPAPFLQDVLAAIKDDPIVLNVEIKEVHRSCDHVGSLVAQLGAGRPSGRWFFTAIDRRNLRCARRMDPEGYLGLIILDGRSLASSNARTASAAHLADAPRLDRAWLDVLLREVGKPVGVHIDALTLRTNLELLPAARELDVPVFAYSLKGDDDLAESIRFVFDRTGYWATGAILDGDREGFCRSVTKGRRG